jgi:hypothetical protein
VHANLDDFVTCFHADKRHDRKPIWSLDAPEGRWRSYAYDELLARDKVSLDIFWLRDKALMESDRGHLRARNKFGRAVLALDSAAGWRVEVCNFCGEWNPLLLERELIRRYRPLFNEHHNTDRPRTAPEQAQLQNRAILGPACLQVLDAGWPSFGDVALETLQDHPPRTRIRRHHR